MKNYFYISILLLSLNINGFTPKKNFRAIKKTSIAITSDPNKETKILETVFNLLKTKHFVEKKIDDNFSKKVFKTYIDSLDRNKIFLLQSDLDEFKKFETRLDDQIIKNDLSFFFFTYDRLILRMREGKEMYTNLLKNSFETNKSGNTIDFSSENPKTTDNLKFKKNKNEQKKYWIDLINYYTIEETKDYYIRINDKITQEQFNDVLKEKYSSLDNGLKSTLLNLENVTKETILEYYINAIVIQFDTNSKYYNPYTRDRYIRKQTGKLEGAGITVRQGTDFVEIKNLMVGSPAEKIKKLEIGDAIIKIAQENEEPLSVVGFKVYDVAKLLKGKAGTFVKITIKKPDGAIETVSIKRAVISTNDSYIKSCLVSKNKIKYGILSFPRFYVDIDDDLSRNSAEDFEEELQILKESEVQGLVIDIRNNNGGSIDEILKILGNFVENYPIIQLKNKNQQVSNLNSTKNNIIWQKNVVLIVNAKTASSAEIFASAFKQFKIGIVIGENTFGKGTVQEYFNLNDYISKKIDNVDYGALQVTTTKLYETNGNGIQNNGVVPDLVFYENNVLRQKKLVDALKNDFVKPLNIELYTDKTLINKTIEISKKSISENENLKLAIINYKCIEQLFKDFKNLKSLNPKILKTQLDQWKNKFNVLQYSNYENKLEFYANISDIKLMKRKQYLVQKRKEWYELLKTDFQIDQAINILELINFNKN